MTDTPADNDWARVEALFHAATSVSPDERATFLEEACPDSPGVRDQVLSLLQHDAERSGLTRIVGEATTQLVGSPVRDGTVIGAYRLLTRIGEGGMGVVYSAERADNLFEKRVAIKLVNAALVSNELRERFMSERQILAALEHANIARLLDGGSTDDGVPYLVMEYVQGEPLDTYCARRALGTRERLELFVKICAAVHYAHQQLVIHCDLKMSNILVTDDGEPRLVDFGVSRLLGKAAAGEAVVEATAGICRLTLRYASPEQVRGEAASTATDAYALGVILYELISGEQPYAVDEADSSAYRQAIIEQVPRLPSGVASPLCARQLRGDLDSILMKALRKSPSERYVSVARFSEDVADYLALRPVMASTGSWHYRFGKLMRRNRVASAVSVALLLSAVTFAGALVERNREIVAQRDVAEFERDKAEAVTEFLTDMFSEASPGRAQGRDITVRAVLDAAGESLDDAPDGHFAESPLVAATIRRSIADVYLSLGMIDTAGPHIEWALDTLRRQGHRESVDYIRALGSKVHWLGLRFEHERARSVAEEALAISTRLLGGDHPLTLHAMGGLGVTYHMTGNLVAGEAIFEEVYQRSAAVLGEGHKDTLGALRRLGIINHWLGNYAKAQDYYRDCVERSARKMGIKHPLALSCRSNQGSTLETMGRYVEAEPVIRDHIADASEVLGENHIETLRSMHNLADVYRGLGQMEKSERLFQEALNRRRETLGDAHVETLQTQMKLARLYRQLGEYDAAMLLMRDVLARQSDGLGDRHPTTLIAAQEMADLLLASGDLDVAATLYESVLEAREATLGAEHPDLIATLAGLAEVRRLSADSAGYRQLMRRAIALADRHPRVSVPDFADSRQRFLEQSAGAGESISTASAAVAGGYAEGPSVSADE